MDQVFPGLSSSPLFTAYTRTCHQSRKSQNLTHAPGLPILLMKAPSLCLLATGGVKPYHWHTSQHAWQQHSWAAPVCWLRNAHRNNSTYVNKWTPYSCPWLPVTSLLTKSEKSLLRRHLQSRLFFSSLFSAPNHTTLWNNNNNDDDDNNNNNNVKVKVKFTLE